MTKKVMRRTVYAVGNQAYRTTGHFFNGLSDSQKCKMIGAVKGKIWECRKNPKVTIPMAAKYIVKNCANDLVFPAVQYHFNKRLNVA